MNASQFQFVKTAREYLSDANRVYTVKLSDEDILFLACLSALESSYGLSYLAIDHNNYIGMHYPVIRNTWCSGRIGRYAKYSSPINCYRDLLCWLFWFGYPDKPLLKVIKKYNSKKSYIPTIQNIVSSFKNFKQNA